MAESENIITYILFFIGILITLLIPIPLGDEYRLFVIITVIFIFLFITMSKFGQKLEDKDAKINDLNKRFKTLEDLNEIRLDIRELKKEIKK